MAKYFTFLFAFGICFATIGQKANEKLIREYLKNNTQLIDLQKSSASDIEIDREVEDQKIGLTHFYVRQTLNGLPVMNATAVFVKKNDVLVLSGNRLVEGVKEFSAKSMAQPAQVILSKVWENISGEENIAMPAAKKIESNKFTINNSHVSEIEIPLELAYFFDGNTFRLIYETSIKVPKENHWWNIYADAQTGEVLKKVDWIVSCSFEGCSTEKHFNYNDLKQKDLGHQLLMAPAPPPQNDTYNVFQLPVESPSHGGRTLVVGPFDAVASPFGWHDVNGAAGNEYTITRGNNVYATEDANDDNIPGYAPDGGTNLVFDFPYTGGAPSTYLDAAITNLFFMNNMMHDVWYHYGFTEAAGNFQENNYGNGGLASDFVNADAQDGSGTNNANFGTPPDGSNPRMQMFIWTTSASAQLLTINSPAAIAGLYSATTANFGPNIPAAPLTQDLVLVNSGGAEPLDACNTVLNSNDLNGKIAVVKRGSCTFVEKVQACQNAGAVAVIVVNNVIGNPIAMGGTSSTITIPSIMVGQTDGNSFIAQLQNPTIVNGTIADAPGANAKDSDLDNMIIAHEYGHGISNRLTGGPNQTGCLGNEDQMGEGWSDWFGLMMTIEPGDLSTDSRGVGTYVTNASTLAQGIRPAPYSTDFALNNYTYGATNNSSISQPHGIGFVWCSMLWDLNWAFIDQYGFDPDLINGTGGNNMVMQLVMEGMKLQPCGPGMVEGRDAILLADQLLYQGTNECIIWRAFAKRGLGFNAVQGDPDDRFDQIENFTIPLVCLAGLDENSFSAQLNVYPNPTDGQISISFSDASQIQTLRILDINGRVVLELNKEVQSKIDIDLSNYHSGVYFVEVSNERGTVTRKIIKE